MKTNQSKRVLCVYGTRQIDSNLFMSSTVFNGLQQCGYKTDILFMGTQEVCSFFKHKYAHYFHHVFNVVLSEGWIKKRLKSARAKLLYSFYLHFFKDGFVCPYSKRKITGIIPSDYDCILSFTPPRFLAYSRTTYAN